MSDDSSTPDRAPKTGRSGRDVSVVAGIANCVFFILALSGALGWVEAITAVIVLTAAAMAYYVGSSQSEPSMGRIEQTSARGRGDTVDPILPILLEALPVPVLDVGQDGRIRFANGPAREAFKLRRDQRIFAASVLRQPKFLTALEHALSPAREPARLELPITGASDQLWIVHITPLNVDSDSALILMEDHTALRRAEKARADFLANASHELSTPLTSVAGFLETMRGPARNDRDNWDRFIDIMFDQTERMKRLIADLLSLSKIEFREHSIPETVENVADLFAIAIEALTPLADDRGMVIEANGPIDQMDAVADADEVTQVALNLISNALKYTETPSSIDVSWGRANSMEEAQRQAGRQWAPARRISILSAPARTSGAALWLRVADKGPGIDQQHLARLGQRFYRVDESRGAGVTGTGLGLAIVKHAMARHRGGVIVESIPGEGSAFGIWLPAATPRLNVGRDESAPPAREPVTATSS
ncbi:MAG: ATP-binding protein [Pseudomonadota bacterium]